MSLIHRCLAGVLALLALATAAAQSAPTPEPMTQQHLQNLIVEEGEDVVISGNVVHFSYHGVDLICISDSAADRMRIVSAIRPLSEVDGQQLLLAMAANFHTALDARYALSDGMIYAAYIHPLSPLTEQEFHSAVAQVATAASSFGDEYSSGLLFFPGLNPE